MFAGLEPLLARWRLTHRLPWMRPAPTAPSLHGALRPNQELDRAMLLAECPAPDNLVWQDDHLLFTSGKRVLLLDSLHQESAEPEEILHFDGEITALAAAEDGSLAVALGAAGIVIVGGAHDGKTITSLGGRKLIAPTALAFSGAETLFVCVGSDLHAIGDWQRDLRERRASGSVWRLSLGSGAALCLASDLGYPSGLLLHDGRIAVSEAWRYRLLDLPVHDLPVHERAAPRVLLDDLPGHPGRLSPAPDGGAWLAVFASRTSAARCNAYGLAVHLDRDFTPTRSLHSRADGTRHGVTSCLEIRGELILACKTGNALVSADLAGELAT